MSELVMMEAALFQLRASLADGDAESLAMRISADVLGNAIAAAKSEGVNAARVNDIEFALADLVSAVDEAGAPDAICSAIALLQNDTAALRRVTALPAETIAAIRELQKRLRERAKAQERSQYRIEGTEAPALPHSREELSVLAVPLARQLTAAGFVTPVLEQLIAERDELRFHTLNELVDELDAIAGA